MSRSGASARRELIGIQRSMARRLRREIYEAIEAPRPELQAYQREYERSCRRPYRRSLSSRVFFSRLAAADIVFQGDFHTLLECQRMTLRVLRQLAGRRPLVLALEAVPITGQRALDAYLAGELMDDAFLEEIDYRSSWGFCWDHYRPILEFARSEDIQVYGINAPQGFSKESLRVRDDRAAEVIARATVAHPQAFVYVVAGDFHVCRQHLPAAVQVQLETEGVSRRSLILHQNIDSYYWELARQKKERGTRFLEMARDEYCVMNSTPLVKYQSYLHWQLGQDELCEADEEEDEGAAASTSDEVYRLLRAITRFLGIRRQGLDDFAVYTTKDLDFLAQLERSGDFSSGEIAEIKGHIRRGESYFISRRNVIYLSHMSIDHAAEQVTHYLHDKLSRQAPRPPDDRADLYSGVLREAFGFLGSMIVNPLRHHHRESDFREILQGANSTHAAGPMPLVELARFVVRHLEVERRLSETGVRQPVPRLRGEELDLRIGISHSLGYILGDKLYHGILEGCIERSEVRRLFCLPLTGECVAEDLYFRLVREL